MKTYSYLIVLIFFLPFKISGQIVSSSPLTVEDDTVYLFIHECDPLITQCKIITYNSAKTLQLDSTSFIYKITNLPPGNHRIIIEYLNSNNEVLKIEESKVSLNNTFLAKYNLIIGPILGAIIAIVVFLLNSFISSLLNQLNKLKVYKSAVNIYINKIIDLNLDSNEIDIPEHLFYPTEHSYVYALSRTRISSRLNEIMELILSFKNEKIQNTDFYVKLKGLKFNVC